MEPWFLFALASALFAGLYSFSTRVSAHYKHHSALMYVYGAISATVLSGIHVIYVHPSMSRIGLIILIGAIDAFVYMLISMARVEALKVIDSTIFFPVYKATSSILAIPLGILLFSDILTGKEVIGIFIGILAPILLISKKEKLRQTNLTKGLLLTGACVVGALLVSSIAKYVNVQELDISLYTFFAFAFGVPFAVLMYKRTNNRKHETRHVEWVGLLGGAFMFLNLIFFLHALSGNLGTVYIINSFSTVIVVALSVLTFREHIDFKKFGALVATVVSLILIK